MSEYVLCAHCGSDALFRDGLCLDCHQKAAGYEGEDDRDDEATKTLKETSDAAFRQAFDTCDPDAFAQFLKANYLLVKSRLEGQTR